MCPAWDQRLLVFREFKLEVQLSKQYRRAVIPRSGYVPKPRVASTLGEQVDIFLNLERVAPVGRNRVAVEIGYSIHYPGLPQRQPWALRHNRFAVKQFEPQGHRGFSKTLGALQT